MGVYQEGKNENAFMGNVRTSVYVASSVLGSKSQDISATVASIEAWLLGWQYHPGGCATTLVQIY